MNELKTELEIVSNRRQVKSITRRPYAFTMKQNNKSKLRHDQIFHQRNTYNSCHLCQLIFINLNESIKFQFHVMEFPHAKKDYSK